MTTQSTSEDDFGAAFKEAMAPKDAPTAEVSAPAPAPTDKPAPAAAAPAPEEQKTQTPDEAAGSKPAAIPAEVQRLLDEAQHRERSASNRISAFATKNSELERKLAELQETVTKLQAATAAQPAAPAPVENDVLTQAPDLEAAVNKRLKALVDPLVKKAEEADKRAAAAEEQVTRVSAVVEPISRTAQKKAFEDTWAQLDGDFTPQWRDDIKSQAFSDFIAKASKEVQALHARAVAPAECADVLDLFYARRGGRPQPKSTAADTAQAEPAATPNRDRLRAAAGVQSRSSARIPDPAANDFDGAFRQAFASMRPT